MTSVAVIGVGSMGVHHARVYNELAEARLVAVADRNPGDAESAARQFNARAYTDYRKLLEVERPEAVSVAVPTAQHEEIAIAALEAGAHILVEKPIAATLEAGQRIIDCARRHKRLLMVGHILRFNPAIQHLKQKLDSGELGRVFQIVCRRIGPFPLRVQDVGVAIDLATHDLDLMRFLTGMDPLRVFAESEHRLVAEHDDLLLGLLRFPEGITGLLEINRLTPFRVREVLVLGERGLFHVDTLTQDMFFHEHMPPHETLPLSSATPKEPQSKLPVSFPVPRNEPLKVEIRAFLQAVQGEIKVPVTGRDSLIALCLALTLLESGREHQVKEIACTGTKKKS